MHYIHIHIQFTSTKAADQIGEIGAAPGLLW